MAERNTEALHADAVAGRPLVFCEPSCLSAVREDAPALLRGESRRRAEQVASVSVLFEEFAATLMARLSAETWSDVCAAARSLPPEVDGRWSVRRRRCCHTFLARASSISMPAAAEWRARSATRRDHYEVSRAIGERKLFPAVRSKAEGSVVVAAGTSCRHQIADFTGETAIHPAMLLESLLP